MVTRLATQQSLFRRFAPYGFTLCIGDLDWFRYKNKGLRANRKPFAVFIVSAKLCRLCRLIKRQPVRNTWNVFDMVFITILSFEIIFCRENFISPTAGDIDCNLPLSYLPKDDKKPLIFFLSPT